MVNSTGKKTVAEMLADYKLKEQRGHTRQSEDTQQLKRLLAARSAHLPGYSWCADWVQWMRNNHPLFGMCCKYRENPIGIGQRMVILIGSVSFGLAATNLVYIFYKTYEDADGTILDLTVGDDATNQSYELTYQMVALWTLGSLLHSLIDLCAWHLTACACCLPGGCLGWCGCLRTVGRYITIALCGIFVALATIAIIVRVNYEESGGEATLDELTTLEIERVESFSFLLSYLIELMLVYCVYYPIMATLFFSGAIRPCLPCIGKHHYFIHFSNLDYLIFIPKSFLLNCKL